MLNTVPMRGMRGERNSISELRRANTLTRFVLDCSTPRTTRRLRKRGMRYRRLLSRGPRTRVLLEWCKGMIQTWRLGRPTEHNYISPTLAHRSIVKCGRTGRLILIFVISVSEKRCISKGLCWGTRSSRALKTTKSMCLRAWEGDTKNSLSNTGSSDQPLALVDCASQGWVGRLGRQCGVDGCLCRLSRSTPLAFNLLLSTE
jgi:hypothetical protein